MTTPSQPTLRVCSWCKASLGFIPGSQAGGISHGICDSCACTIRKELQQFVPVGNAPSDWAVDLLGCAVFAALIFLTLFVAL